MPTNSIDAKLYRNAGSYSAPSWTEIDFVKDLNVNTEQTEVDVTTRGGAGHRLTKAGIRDTTIEFEIDFDTADASFTSLRDAYLNRTDIELLALNGSSATSGNQGVRGNFQVTNFSRNEPLDGHLTVNVTCKIAGSASGSSAPMEWHTV